MQGCLCFASRGGCVRAFCRALGIFSPLLALIRLAFEVTLSNKKEEAEVTASSYINLAQLLTNCNLHNLFFSQISINLPAPKTHNKCTATPPTSPQLNKLHKMHLQSITFLSQKTKHRQMFLSFLTSLT